MYRFCSVWTREIEEYSDRLLEKLDAYMPSCEGIDTGRLYRDVLAALEQIDSGVLLSAYPRIHTSSAAGS